MLDIKSMLQDDMLIQTRAIAHRLNRIEDAATRQLIETQEQDIQRGIEIAIRKTLKYSCLMDRHEDIPEAHKKTFGWIFQDEGTSPWASFNDWLLSGSGLYWINGKAGSGKSTLMRFIYDSTITQQRLRVWAEQPEPVPSVTAGFFFWNSGTKDQRSKSGLLRSLLYEVLTKYPELIPVVLPGVWATQYSQALNPLLKIEYDIRPLSKLTQAFRNLANQTTVPIKLCFFIDGLDEYDGSDEDVAKIFSDLEGKPNIKLCVSSRPSPVFEKLFANAPGLRLQDLTREDIKDYVNDILGQDELYIAQSQKEPVLAPILISEIVEKAQGVFLWVALVVRSLLQGLWGEDTIIELQERLTKLPRGLGALYKHMLTERIDPNYLPRASRIFQILRAGLHPVPTLYHIEESELMRESERKQLTILDLALADDSNARLLESNAKDLSPSELTDICCSMCTRLKARCAGLVEIQGFESLLEVSSGTKKRMKKPDYSHVNLDDKVQYLHRTVRDFLETPDVWNKLVEQVEQVSGKIWNPSTCLLRSCVAQLSVARCALSVNAYRSVALQAMVHAHQADPRPSLDYFQLLERLDHVMVRNLQVTGSLRQSGSHWATHECSLCESEDPDEEGCDISANQDSFISLAVQYGLCNFLADSFKKNKKLLQQKPGRPLLDYALWPGVDMHAEERFPASPEVIRILLQHGANPNEPFNGRTCWENGLTFLSSISSGSDDLDANFILERLEFVVLLVQANANLAAIDTPDGTLTPQTIVELMVDKWCPQEQDQVKKMFENRSKTGVLQYLGKLFGLAF